MATLPRGSMKRPYAPLFRFNVTLGFVSQVSCAFRLVLQSEAESSEYTVRSHAGQGSHTENDRDRKCIISGLKNRNAKKQC